MEASLQNRWIELEEEKKLIENEIQKASLPQQQYSEGKESWNMLQVMAHLIAVEKTGFDFLRSKNYTNARKAKGKWHLLGAFILRIMLRSSLRFKVPPFPSLIPSREKKKEDLLVEWEKEREKIKIYLEGFPADKLDMLIFKHPATGWLTIEQTLGFLIEHIRHHQRQIKRIQLAKGYPH